MRVYYITIFVVLSISTVQCDTRGSCPPTLGVDICEPACSPDNPCGDLQLCCPTACGGSMCVDPVTERRNNGIVKPGKCPTEPRGRWICSATCTGDNDCRDTRKCCANRCGALTCQKPEPEAEVHNLE